MMQLEFGQKGGRDRKWRKIPYFVWAGASMPCKNTVFCDMPCWPYEAPSLCSDECFCLPKVSYAIGVAQPLSISLFTYGTSQKTEKELLDIVHNNFDLRPGVIVR